MTMTDDPIVEEVRNARRKISEFYGNNLHAIAEAAAQGFPGFPEAKALGMTYGEYCLAEVEGTLPLRAGEAPADCDA